MPAKLVLTRDLSTALQHTNDQIENISVEKPLSATYLLLPTTAAIRNIRWHLGSSLGMRLVQFYSLGEMLLDESRSPVHRLGNLSIRRLVSQITRDLYEKGELTGFSKVWDKPGFIQVLIDWLREVKSQGISPEEVQVHARQTKKDRDRQLATIYQRYQEFLHTTNTSDADGLLWLAAEMLENDEDLLQSQEPFFVLGFDHFNPLQVRILKQISKRRSELFIYLLWDSERHADSLALYRLARTGAMLQEELKPQVIYWQGAGTQSSSLTHLRGTLFELKAEQPVGKADQSVQAVVAPSREAEVRYAVRSIKKLLLDGVPPHQIGLLATDKHTYLPIVRAVAQEYGVPIQVEERLMDQPVIAQLINLLRLFPDFPWRQTMDALRSPYFCQLWLSAEQIDLLDQLTRQRPVVAGKDQWQYALQLTDVGEELLDDDERQDEYLIDQLTHEKLSEIETGLLAFFDQLTPLLTASIRDYGFWLQQAIIGPFPDEQMDSEEPALQEEVITSLQMWSCCEQSLEFGTRELQAIAALTEAISQMIASSRMRAPDFEAEISWENFRDDLINLLHDEIIPADSTRAAVAFDAIQASRSAVFDTTFVLGLGEGEFPRPLKADCLYSPEEREHHPLPLLHIHPGEDACLWWQVIGNCRKTLVMLRPYLDENGADWLPSPYWEEVSDRLGYLEEIVLPIAQTPTIEQAACQHEILMALAISGAQEIPAAIDREWQASNRAYRVVRTRQSWQPAGVFEGYLESGEILSELSGRFGTSHRWSPSRLNRYGYCPFGFFAETVLRLEARDDPVDGLDVMQQGSLLHDILERLHASAAREGWEFIQENQDMLLQRLEAICEETFLDAPERFGFRPSALWKHEQKELFRLLRTLVTWECETNGDQAQFRPFLQEVRFGFGGSRLPALTIQNGEGRAYQVAGIIDRLDIDRVGNLRVIDYKSGSAGFSKRDLESGLAFQTAIYALAVEPLLAQNARVVESAYLHIPRREKSGVLKFAGRVGEDSVVQGIVSLALEFIECIQQGEFPSKPGKSAWGTSGCQRWCDFSSLCRVNRMSIVKSRQRREM